MHDFNLKFLEDFKMSEITDVISWEWFGYGEFLLMNKSRVVLIFGNGLFCSFR